MDSAITVSKWGNSLGLRIPALAAKTLNLAAGDVMRLELEGNAIRLTKANTTVFDMTSVEFEEACREAVLNRDEQPEAEYVTRLDPESGGIIKVFSDGRIEYVLE